MDAGFPMWAQQQRFVYVWVSQFCFLFFVFTPPASLPSFCPSVSFSSWVFVCVQVLSVWPGLQGLPTLLRLRPRCGHPVWGAWRGAHPAHGGGRWVVWPGGVVQDLGQEGLQGELHSPSHSCGPSNIFMLMAFFFFSCQYGFSVSLWLELAWYSVNSVDLENSSFVLWTSSSWAGTLKEKAATGCLQPLLLKLLSLQCKLQMSLMSLSNFQPLKNIARNP